MLEAIYQFLAVFSLLVAYFLVYHYQRKIRALKKEKAEIFRLLEKDEKKLENFGVEKNKFYKIILNFNEGILILGSKNNISMANSYAREILGVKSRDLNGMHLSELELFEGLKTIIPYFSSRRDVTKKEVRLRGLFIELSVTRLPLEENNNGSLIVMRDITKEKTFEREKNEFLLSTIHRLKTSMSSVKWLVKMFLSGDFGKLDKGQEAVMKKLYERNESVFPLISDLLNATKIEEGAYIYKKTSVDIQELVQSSVAYFKDKIKSKKIKLEFKKPAHKLPKIMADKEKIESVVQNLFDNALKYTPAKGKMSISLESSEKEIEFSIADSGIGIPEYEQSKIFSKFFRAKNANKIDTDGSGLGLFIAKKIIEDHKGSIGFESKEGEGSRFYFTLPL